MARTLTIILLLAASLAGAQFEAIKTLTPEQGQKVRRPIETIIFGSTQEELPALEAELLEIFQSLETTLEGKRYTCRMLRHCASDASVPVLAPELTNPELEEFVRRVFQSLETPAANEALLEALSTEADIGIIGTLGQIGSSTSIAAIAPYLENDSPEFQFAAIAALGNIGGKKAVKALQAATVKPEFSKDWKQAQLKCAETIPFRSFLFFFNRNSAWAFYSPFLQDDDETIQSGALVGFVKANPDEGADLVLDYLDEGGTMHHTALALLSELPTDELADELDDLDDDEQIIVVGELANRKSAEAEEAVLELLEDSDDDDEIALQSAAFRALGMMGGAKSIQPLLAAAMENLMAYNALCALNAKGTDAAIIHTLETTEDDQLKVKMIDCLSVRQAQTALPLFVELAKGEWSRTSAAAISGMANLMTEKDFGTYAELILATDSKKKIQALETSIATAARRLPDPYACAQPLVAAYQKAEGKQQLALIRALGSIGGTDAHAVLAQALASSDEKVKDAAIRGLCNWPNTEVEDQLLDLTVNADTDKHKVLALRGYIRLANTYANEKDALPMCKKAAALTDRPEELKSIIACAKRFKSEDVVEFMAPMLENPAIIDEAGQGMIEQTWHWRSKQFVLPHLERYVELTSNEQMKAYAQSTIKELIN